jgi:predicted transcriptional regulator
MSTQNVVTFRTDKKTKIDKIAKQLHGTRSNIINNAIESYIDLYEWQERKIKKGLEDIKEGRFLSGEEARKIFKR